MRLAVRLLIAGLALSAVLAAAAGCSDAPGVAYAAGTTGPAATASGPVKTTVPAKASVPVPSGPTIVVTGAPSGVGAKAGILVDATTGQVLWAADPDAPRPIASIAKVMTALLVIQAGTPNQEITVPSEVTAYVAKYGAEAVGLIPGQRLTTDELLNLMLIGSAADAAYTLANAYGPGLPAFIAKMNAEAAKLGLTDTHFTSPDGLPYPTETSTYSTPAELVKLGETAMQYPEFRSIVRTQFYSVPAGDGHSAYSVSNDDKLVGTYAGFLGIKTGYTNGAGHTLLFEAERDGRLLIGDVLGTSASSPYTAEVATQQVLNWGFSLKQTG